jgi:hypothetical protein
MTPSEIINQEAQKVGYDADVMLRKINKLVQTKAAILLQKNDSVLLLINIAKGVVELHIFTTDTPARIVDSLKFFIGKIKTSDIKTVYGSGDLSKDTRLKKSLDLLDKMGVDVQKSNLKQYTWMATVEGSK